MEKEEEQEQDYYALQEKRKTVDAILGALGYLTFILAYHYLISSPLFTLFYTNNNFYYLLAIPAIITLTIILASYLTKRRYLGLGTLLMASIILAIILINNYLLPYINQDITNA